MADTPDDYDPRRALNAAGRRLEAAALRIRRRLLANTATRPLPRPAPELRITAPGSHSDPTGRAVARTTSDASRGAALLADLVEDAHTLLIDHTTLATPDPDLVALLIRDLRGIDLDVCGCDDPTGHTEHDPRLDPSHPRWDTQVRRGCGFLDEVATRVPAWRRNLWHQGVDDHIDLNGPVVPLAHLARRANRAASRLWGWDDIEPPPRQPQPTGPEVRVCTGQGCDRPLPVVVGKRECERCRSRRRRAS